MQTPRCLLQTRSHQSLCSCGGWGPAMGCTQAQMPVCTRARNFRRCAGFQLSTKGARLLRRYVREPPRSAPTRRRPCPLLPHWPIVHQRAARTAGGRRRMIASSWCAHLAAESIVCAKQGLLTCLSSSLNSTPVSAPPGLEGLWRRGTHFPVRLRQCFTYSSLCS